MSTDDLQRTRFRRPLGLLIMGYKAALGLSEIFVGTLLAFPGFDPQATFARLSAEELHEDPGDRFVALVTRHLPSLLHHRGPVAVGLILLGLAQVGGGGRDVGGQGVGRLFAGGHGHAAAAFGPAPSRRLPNGQPCTATGGKCRGGSCASPLAARLDTWATIPRPCCSILLSFRSQGDTTSAP